MTPSPPSIAIYPGSFDPVTLGHEDVAYRTLRVADRLVIAVAHSATHAKQPLFTVEERVALLKEVFASEPRVECTSFQGLLVEFARARKARFIVRGLRNVADFEFEHQIGWANSQMAPEVELCCLFCNGEYAYLSATILKEVASLGGDYHAWAPAHVLEALRRKFPEATAASRLISRSDAKLTHRG